MGRTKEILSCFPDVAKLEVGHQLFRVQQGLLPTDWKPMKAVGSGVFEVRIHLPHEHRMLYVAKFPEAVYALHAFEKKTQKTPLKEIEIAQKAYKAMLAYRTRS